eukprot:gene14985-21043_t
MVHRSKVHMGRRKDLLGLGKGKDPMVLGKGKDPMDLDKGIPDKGKDRMDRCPDLLGLATCKGRQAAPKGEEGPLAAYQDLQEETILGPLAKGRDLLSKCKGQVDRCQDHLDSYQDHRDNHKGQVDRT